MTNPEYLRMVTCHWKNYKVDVPVSETYVKQVDGVVRSSARDLVLCDAYDFFKTNGIKVGHWRSIKSDYQSRPLTQEEKERLAR